MGAGMTTPKPVSAPQADALRGLLRLWRTSERSSERMTQFDKGYEQASDECADALETELNALAASAQVREGEALCAECGDKRWMPAGDGEVPCLFCNKHGRKPAAEPAPVAQEIARFDFTEGGFEDENERGHYVRYADHVATIADHARREAELESQLVSARTRIGQLEAACDGRFADYDRELKRANSLEASLAACRANEARYLWLREHFRFANDSLHEIWFDSSLEPDDAGVPGDLDAAIDALRQEAPHAE